MGYLAYYLVFFLASFVLRYPPLLVGILVFFLLRRFIPDPWVWLKTLGRIARLRREVDANPANATARRDLATIYLERMRPGAALKLLEEAGKRFPNDAEILFLTGLARYRKGDAEGALAPLIHAVEIDGRLRFGEPFLVAGDALADLGRWAEALDAYERYSEILSSSIQGHLKRALMHKKLGDDDAAKRALGDAFDTWRQIPGYKRRRELGWWLRAQASRLWV